MGIGPRVLYLTAGASPNGRNYLRGRQLVTQLRHEGELRLAHCWIPKKDGVGEPRLLNDLVDEAELQAFRPQVIFSERGLFRDPRGTWRIPREVIEDFVRAGGVFVVTDVDQAEAEDHLSAYESASDFFQTSFSAAYRRGRSIAYGHDSSSYWEHPRNLVCHPEAMLISDWLRPTYRGIDAVTAIGPVPLNSGAGILASADPTADLLESDRFVSRGYAFPFATVRQIGVGYACFIAGGVSNDYVVTANPDNARWLATVLRNLVDEAQREQELHTPQSAHGFEANQAHSDGRIVSPNTPYGNILALRQVLRRANKWIAWYEPQMPPKVLEVLYRELDNDRVEKVRLLSGPANLGRDDRREFLRLRKEFSKMRRIDIQWRVLSPKTAFQHHDRILWSEDVAFNLPPLNTILAGSTGEILASGLPIEAFETWWAEGTEIGGWQPEP